jgi:hypothetical protein
MSNGAVDLDNFGSWLEEVRLELDTNLNELIAEHIAQVEFDRSVDRWHKPAPAQPLNWRAQELIMEKMKMRKLRVFHAMRLLDFDEVLCDGFRPLVLQERISRLRELAAQGCFTGFDE